MNNPLGGENSLSEALCKIEGASRGAGATPLEAGALARKEIIKAKVALEDMHGQWKRTAPKLAAAVFLWTALHLKQYEHGGLKGETVEQLLRGGDALLWAHMVSLLLTLYLMASHWMAKRKRLQVFLTGRKQVMTLLFIAELFLFGYNTYMGSNADLSVPGEEAGNLTVGNPHKHYPFAAALYAVLLGQDVYMSTQQAQSYKRFVSVDRLYKELEKKGKVAAGAPAPAPAQAQAQAQAQVEVEVEVETQAGSAKKKGKKNKNKRKEA